MDLVRFGKCSLTLRMYNSPQYADLSEFGYGVAILSESKYGFSCRGNVLRISLLRAATAPDAEQDQGSYHPCGCVTLNLKVLIRGALVLLGRLATPRPFPGVRRPDCCIPVQFSLVL